MMIWELVGAGILLVGVTAAAIRWLLGVALNNGREDMKRVENKVDDLADRVDDLGRNITAVATSLAELRGEFKGMWRPRGDVPPGPP